MSRAEVDDERWVRWCRDMDDVHREIVTTFHNRWVLRTMLEMLDFNPDVEQATVITNWMKRCYATTVCTAIRRECDGARDTTSLARCLESLVECPHIATRRRWVQGVESQTQDEGVRRYANAGFDIFAASGSDLIDPGPVTADIERLRAAAGPVKKYTDKVLAHRARNGRAQPINLRFDQIDHALETLGEVYLKYYRLRHLSGSLGSLAPIVERSFLTMFQAPWYADGFVPPDERDLS
jgi:hypothetical protein